MASVPGPPGPGMINLKVKTMRQDLGSLTVDIASDALVSSLKEQLAAVSSIPAPQQRLIFKGRVLRDEQKLNEAGVEAGNTLHLVERPPDVMQHDGQPEPAAQPGQLPTGPGGMPDLGQFLQGLFASLSGTMPGAPQAGAAPAAGGPGAAAGQAGERPEPVHMLAAVDSYLEQLQAGGDDAVAPIMVTSLAPRTMEGLAMLHRSLTTAIGHILEGVELTPELAAMLADATAHPDRLGTMGGADTSTGASPAAALASQPGHRPTIVAGHRPTIASDPALQARLAQQSYPYMPLALAAVVQLLRRTQVHLTDVLGPALARAVEGLGGVMALDAPNAQQTETQLRSVAGILHGSAALLTELSRAMAATMHAVGGNTAALAANGAAVLDPAAGAQPVFPRLLPRSNIQVDMLLPMGINIPVMQPPSAQGSQPGAPQQPAAAGGAAAAAGTPAPAGPQPGQDMGANVLAALTQQLPGLFGAMQQGGAVQSGMPSSGAATVTVWPATVETVQIDMAGGDGGAGGLANLLSLFGGGAAGAVPMAVDGVPAPGQPVPLEQPNSAMAQDVAFAVMRALGPMVTSIANQVVGSAGGNAAGSAAPAGAAAGSAAAAGAGLAGAPAGTFGAAGADAAPQDAASLSNAVSSALAQVATVLSSNSQRIQQELQQVQRETAAGAPWGQVLGSVVQRALTTLATQARTATAPSGTPTAAHASASTGAGTTAQAAPAGPAAADAAAAAIAPSPSPAAASQPQQQQQPRGLGGSLRPTLPAKRKSPAAPAAANGAGPSTSAAAGGSGLSTPGLLAPVVTSGASSGSGSAPGSPGAVADRRKSLTRTPTPGLLRLTESGRSTPRGDLHPLREFPVPMLNEMAEGVEEDVPAAPTAAAAAAAASGAGRQPGAAVSGRPAGGAAGGAPDLTGLLQMLGGLAGPPQPGGAGAAAATAPRAPAAGVTPAAAGPVAPRPGPPSAAAGGGADLSGLMQMMGGLMGAPPAGGAGTAGAAGGAAPGGGMGGLMQMAAQVASDPNMQPLLNNMAASLFGGGGGGAGGGGAGGLGGLLSGLLGGPPPGQAAAGPSALVGSMDALDAELSPSEAAAWKAMMEADEAGMASSGPQGALSEVYLAGAAVKAPSLMSVLGGEPKNGNGSGASRAQ